VTGVLSALEFFLGVEELHWGYLGGTQRKIGRTRAGVVLPESLAILSSPATRSTLFFTLLFFPFPTTTITTPCFQTESPLW
jgi:hypothetical protein